jgi:hypothetical protein
LLNRIALSLAEGFILEQSGLSVVVGSIVEHNCPVSSGGIYSIEQSGLSVVVGSIIEQNCPVSSRGIYSRAEWPVCGSRIYC